MIKLSGLINNSHESLVYNKSPQQTMEINFFNISKNVRRIIIESTSDIITFVDFNYLLLQQILKASLKGVPQRN